MSWIVILVAVFILLLLAKNWIQSCTERALPPGPSLVNSFKIMMGFIWRDDVINVADKLASKYGDIFVIRFLGHNMVFMNNSRVIRKVYSAAGYRDKTNDRAPSFLRAYLYRGGKDIAFCDYSDFVMKLRKIVHNVARLYGDGIREFEEMVSKQLRDLEEKLEKGVGQEKFDLMTELHESVIKTVHIFITNQAPDEEVVSVVSDFNSSFNKSLTVNKNIILGLFPWLKYLPGANRRLVQELDTNSQRLIEFYLNPKAREHVKGNGGLIDTLLTEQAKDPQLTDEFLQGVIMDAVAGGYISTAGALCGFFLLMLHYPEVQHRIQEELDEKVKGRQPSLDDRPTLHYTNATVLEVFRYIRHVPLTLPHQSKEDIEIEGYRIPANSPIIANLWTSFRGSNDWGPDDNKFKPERFLDNEWKLLPVDHPLRQQWIPFGIGKRNCVGESFAKSRLFLYVTTLLQKFEFQTGSNKLASEDSAYWDNNSALQPPFINCKIVKRK
ncbi:hypothetical protein LOTGIDRAFT_158000 [Lottia gigantea]|uniref:Cytochrome P450 n=1 Tax=Lottia gigantea TaxID=225164 RepID=V4ATT0_LOTGI|nr:hypothetical protein LOTGIDRAFT_158000 [Lottia gigantea]ESP00708.1 hypothetical protein LOTGIDRAFT_158000 [Lottia gigantea]